MRVQFRGAAGQEHMKYRTDGGIIGKQDEMICRNGILRDCKLEPGQVQHTCFQPGDPPPFKTCEASLTEFPTGKKIRSDETGRLADGTRRGNGR